MIESIEKLRRYKLCEPLDVCTRYFDSGEIADEIEAEIAERYMELPVDADGVPIRCGDTVSGGMGDSGKVQHVEIWPDGFVVVYEHQPGQFTRYSNGAIHHVKPRTIEDVLRDLVDGIGSVEFDALTAIGEAAEEIRELMEVDR